MAQTRDNGAKTPTGSDPYHLTQDLATFADSLNVVTPVASAAARDALTKFEGRQCVRTDLGGLTQTVVDGAWVSNYSGPYRQYRFITTREVTGTGLTWDIPLPTGYFTLAPLVVVGRGSSGGAMFIPYLSSVSTSSVKVGVYATPSTSTTYSVTLIVDLAQMTPANAGGAAGV